MRPDRWNPRVWLRDWLMKPTAGEQARAETGRKSAFAMHTVELDPDSGEIIGIRVEGMPSVLDDQLSIQSGPDACPEDPESRTPKT